MEKDNLEPLITVFIMAWIAGVFALLAIVHTLYTRFVEAVKRYYDLDNLPIDKTAGNWDGSYYRMNMPVPIVVKFAEEEITNAIAKHNKWVKYYWWWILLLFLTLIGGAIVTKLLLPYFFPA